VPLLAMLIIQPIARLRMKKGAEFLGRIEIVHQINGFYVVIHLVFESAGGPGEVKPPAEWGEKIKDASELSLLTPA
jgi:hypothetical protein